MAFLCRFSLLVLALASRSLAMDDLYAQKPGTRLGCECKDDGQCTTSLLFKCDVASYCAVKDKACAKGTAPYSYTMGSYYDYCTYDPYKIYEVLKASEKQALVLDKLKDGGSGAYPATLGVLTGIMGESVKETFEASADVFPHLQTDKRSKWIHSVGATGGVRFESTNDHPYTGLFQGAEHGIIRFSSAKAPDSSGVTPGMGVKFFRDGRPSANFVAMYSLDGQPCSDNNFFAHPWKNHISLTDNFGLKLIAAKFWQASYCPLQVGLSDLSSNGQGNATKFPYQLTFLPLVKSECSCTDYDKCLANLVKNVEVGKPIFEVQATADPGEEPRKIGQIYTTSAFVRSKFGDEELFFKHQHMEEDFEQKPKWLDAIDRKQECGMSCTGLKPPPIEKGCSSPFNNTVSGMLETDSVTI